MTVRKNLALEDVPADCRPDSITSDEAARTWLEALIRENLQWHPEDDPATVGNYIDGVFEYTFATPTSDRFDELMDQVYGLKSIDPCSVILEHLT